MSAVLNSEDSAPVVEDKPGTIEIREGDWKAYKYFTGPKCRDAAVLHERFGSALEYKRACALAYLGRRAQLRGGVCSLRHPHIMTPQYLLELEQANRNQRFSRYPWLGALMNVLAEIERLQDEISQTSNVISLVPSGK